MSKKTSKKNKNIILILALLIVLATIFAPKILDLTGRTAFDISSSNPYLVSYFKFESDATDEMGYNNAINIHGADCALYIPGYNSDSSSCKFINTHNDYINLGSNSNSLSLVEDMTIIAWIKLDSIDKDQSIFSRSASWTGSKLSSSGSRTISVPTYPNYTNYNFLVNDENKLRMYWTQGSQEIECVSLNNINMGVWTHVVITRYIKMGSTIKLYINGVEDNSCISPSTPTYYGDQALNDKLRNYIGARHYYEDDDPDRPFTGPLQPFNGEIDDIRVYNHTLTATDIEEIYNSELGTGAAGASFAATMSPTVTTILGTDYYGLDVFDASNNLIGSFLIDANDLTGGA